MLADFRNGLLRLLRVPAEPALPPGAGDVRIFRASARYYWYKVALWGLAQAGVLAGLITTVVFVGSVASVPGLPSYAATLIRITEVGAWIFFIVQIPITFALLRLDFDMRWYVLTDRSLRIREGILSVNEKTMTFANIQQINVKQNPLQRLLKIADVQVRSAGGSAGESGGSGGSGGMNEASFSGVDNPESIRQAVLERVRLHRDAGLGDPDDHAPRAAPVRSSPGALDAARGLHGEIRALRRALEP